LGIIDRLFYYFGYIFYLNLKLAFHFCSSESDLSTWMKFGCILLFPIYLLCIFFLAIIKLFFQQRGTTIDVTKLQLCNQKFRNEIISDYNLTEDTKSVWEVYLLTHDLHSYKVKESIINKSIYKIMRAVQFGNMPLNHADIYTMLKQNSADISTFMSQIREELKNIEKLVLRKRKNLKRK
jgi:hypothetical protein